MICGVDEAGKGSVFGPLVIGAVRCPSEETLADLPLRDSKAISPKERERLALLIRERARVTTVKIDAREIDVIRREMTLNSCVARAHAEAINKLSPKAAYVDACDVNPLRYAEMVRTHLAKDCEIVSEHHADSTFPIVSAASIIAKVSRDNEIKRLTKKYGAIGSGYPSDPVTIGFLSSWIDEHKEPPPFARKSWKTVTAMIGRKEQSSLANFL